MSGLGNGIAIRLVLIAEAMHILSAKPPNNTLHPNHSEEEGE